MQILNLKKAGYIEFQFESKALEELLEVHVFIADKYSGNIRECDGKHLIFLFSFKSPFLYFKNLEIMPQWYDTDKIPFDKMWKDDIIWFPKLLSEKLFKAYFLFKDDQETIVNYTLDEVESL